MITLSIVSFLVGAVLGQHFKVLVLMPTTAILVVLSAATGLTQSHTVWSIVLTVAAAAASIQVGYLIGIGVHHVLPATWSSGSASLTSPTASTSARQSAR
jgi:hypothetical protein